MPFFPHLKYNEHYGYVAFKIRKHYIYNFRNEKGVHGGSDLEGDYNTTVY